MSTRVSYALVVVLLLIAAVLRLVDLGTLPPGMSDAEVVDARITETARLGRIEAFYDLGDGGREGLYGVGLAAATAFTGGGLLGYRFFSVCVGLLTLALTYALGRRLFGGGGGLAAATLLAVSMYPIVLSRSIGAEVLLPLWTTATLLAIARAFPLYGDDDRELSPLPFAGVGALLGIGLYIHPANLFLTLFAVLFIAYWVLARRPLSARLYSYIWFALVIFIVFGTPYLLSSVQRPDLNGAARVFDPEGFRRPLESIVNMLGGLAFVGDRNPAHNLPGRPLFDLVSALLAVIGIAVAIVSRRQPRYTLLLLALVFLLPPALLVSDSPNFPRLAPLLPLLALFFGLGASVLSRTITRALPRPARTVLVSAAALLLFGFNLAWAGDDVFREWPNHPQTLQAYHARIGAAAHYLDQTARSLPTTVCTGELSANPRAPLNDLTDRQRLALMMSRNEVRLRFADCGSALVLTAGGAREQVVLLDGNGLGAVHPYLQTWIAGEPGVLGSQRPDVPNLPPGSVWIFEAGARLADTVGAFTTTAPISYPPEGIGGREVAAPPLRFTGNLAYLGDVRAWEGEYAPGGLFSIITYWRVDGELPPDLRFFAHVLSDPADCCSAQNDTIGVLPASLEPRDVVVQVINVQLPYTLRSGVYSVSVGAYEANVGTRLVVFDGDQPRATRLFLGALRIERG